MCKVAKLTASATLMWSVGILLSQPQDLKRPLLSRVNGGHEIRGRAVSGSSAAANATAGKSTRHSFPNLRAGVIKTGNGWNAKDFAVSIMNPNSQEIAVTWKLISDDPKFVFRDGSVGTWTQTVSVPALMGKTLNVYGPAVYGPQDPTVTHFAVPALTNFKGLTEFFSSLPFYVYSGHDFETAEASSTDPDKAWYDAWNAWGNNVPVAWDADLQQFVIPYTNYWHNVKEWPVGWHSTFVLKNNSDQKVTYSIQHRPVYGTLKDPDVNCRVTDYQDQTVPVVLDKGQELNTTLEGLYGWPAGQTSFMEGIVLIRPTPITAATQTTVTSSVIPNSFGTSSCASRPLVSVAIASPVATVSGTVNVTASTVHLAQDVIEKVEFYVDGKLATTATTNPYTFSWNTTSVRNGSHTLTARALDNGGEATTQTVNVTVFNPSAR